MNNLLKNRKINSSTHTVEHHSEQPQITQIHFFSLEKPRIIITPSNNESSSLFTSNISDHQNKKEFQIDSQENDTPSSNIKDIVLKYSDELQKSQNFTSKASQIQSYCTTPKQITRSISFQGKKTKQLKYQRSRLTDSIISEWQKGCQLQENIQPYRISKSTQNSNQNSRNYVSERTSFEFEVNNKRKTPLFKQKQKSIYVNTEIQESFSQTKTSLKYNNNQKEVEEKKLQTIQKRANNFFNPQNLSDFHSKLQIVKSLRLNTKDLTIKSYQVSSNMQNSNNQRTPSSIQENRKSRQRTYSSNAHYNVGQIVDRYNNQNESINTIQSNQKNEKKLFNEELNKNAYIKENMQKIVKSPFVFLQLKYPDAVSQPKSSFNENFEDESYPNSEVSFNTQEQEEHNRQQYSKQLITFNTQEKQKQMCSEKVPLIKIASKLTPKQRKTFSDINNLMVEVEMAKTEVNQYRRKQRKVNKEMKKSLKVYLPSNNYTVNDFIQFSNSTKNTEPSEASISAFFYNYEEM